MTDSLINSWLASQEGSKSEKLRKLNTAVGVNYGLSRLGEWVNGKRVPFAVRYQILQVAFEWALAQEGIYQAPPNIFTIIRSYVSSLSIEEINAVKNTSYGRSRITEWANGSRLVPVWLQEVVMPNAIAQACAERGIKLSKAQLQRIINRLS